MPGDRIPAFRAGTTSKSRPTRSHAAAGRRERIVNAETIRCMARTRVMGNLSPPWPVYCLDEGTMPSGASMFPMNDLFTSFARSYDARRETEMSLSEYLEGCRDDPMMYAGAPERILAAIGEPQLLDTARDARLGRIFMNRTIRFYPAFSEFYGMEETIERIVSFFRHAAQGLEERKQILYLLGPVGG